ncbi:MAG: aspartate kinase [Chitinophagales bacterium]|nr:aspartate kinase [Chitinophagales bacterium]MDW8420025.1 aspartate kinase [Chitinophagales bacterium]
MQVFKFGGASVKDAPAVRNVIAILQQHPGDKVVVISAMGKTTNELEGVVNRYYAGDKSWAEALEHIFEKHAAIIRELYEERDSSKALHDVRTITDHAAKFLRENQSRNYNYIYDQVVSQGEYLSTTIVSDYATAVGLRNTLLDVKEVLYTDNAYTEGKVDFKKTEKAITEKVKTLLPKGIIITQGFVGCTPEGFATTLGREGSDYTASIFAYALHAERMTVWKDVDGILNADPKEFPDAQLLNEISYHEAIEMTYYGASVIHPKTIKPIQNRNIPLEVRSFVNHQKRGTLITANAHTGFLPPIIIWKRGQSLLSFSAKDFSFIAEEHLSKVFGTFAECRLRINLMQNAAISFSVAVDYKKEKIEQITDLLQQDFQISQHDGLSLLTIRHYHQGIIDKLTSGKDILLRQISRQTIQVLLRE